MYTNKKVIFEDLGLIDYQAAWDYQEQLLASTVAQKINNQKLAEGDRIITQNHLLFCQHPNVYTLGRSGKAENLLADEEKLTAIEAQYFKTNRGGDITYHGPGQLVVYPILDLDHFFTDIHLYMRRLEEAVIKTCADFGITAGRIEGLTGVWIEDEAKQNPRKICAMGVKASRWVTMHGLALNINPDLSYFGHIVPCGINDKAVTSMANELGYSPNFNEVSSLLKNHLTQLFEMELV